MLNQIYANWLKNQFLQNIAHTNYNMLTSILTDIYNAILMDIFNSQPATEEDPDEGIKDLVEITLKKFVSTLATPPPPKKNK